MGNVFCTSSDVSGSYTPFTIAILDVVLKGGVAFPSLLTNDKIDLLMGWLLNEFQYFLFVMTSA